jgi:hypothetical protein
MESLENSLVEGEGGAMHAPDAASRPEDKSRDEQDANNAVDPSVAATAPLLAPDIVPAEDNSHPDTTIQKSAYKLRKNSGTTLFNSLHFGMQFSTLYVREGILYKLK